MRRWRGRPPWSRWDDDRLVARVSEAHPGASRDTVTATRVRFAYPGYERKDRAYFMYFQFRDFPSASHSTVCATRRCRVSSRLASTIHSM